MKHSSNTLVFKRLGIHTQHEHFVYYHRDHRSNLLDQSAKQIQR